MQSSGVGQAGRHTQQRVIALFRGERRIAREGEADRFGFGCGHDSRVASIAAARHTAVPFKWPLGPSAVRAIIWFSEDQRMRGGERYKARGVEAELEPGSRGRVLRNLAGIRSVRNMERRALRQFTPCRFDDPGEQAHALGVVHAELVLIHPFREGNGRCARLLATLMALQAKLPALDFGGTRGEEKRRYIAAIQAAMTRDYAPIGGIFRAVIARTLRSQARALGG